jgi:hypothetical protein
MVLMKGVRLISMGSSQWSSKFTGIPTVEGIFIPPADAGRNFQLRTALVADWSKSVYPEDRLTETETGSPEALTDTIRSTKPWRCSILAC